MSGEPTMAPPAPPGPRAGLTRGAPIFLLALLIGVAAHAAGFALFRIDLTPAHPVPPPPPLASYPRPGLSAQGDAWQRNDLLFDPARLYLPATVERPVRKVGESVRPLVVFDAEPADVTLSPDDFRPPSAAASPPASPIDALKPRQWDVLNALGQTASEVPPLSRRGARLQVRRLTATHPADSKEPESAVVASFNWPEAQTPPTQGNEWKPASFFLAFDDKGLAGEPMLFNSSRSDVADKFLREQLRWWFARRPLRAGIYEVIVGP